MATKLLFHPQRVKELVEHARACSEHNPTFAQMLDEDYHRDGAGVGKWPSSEDIDKTKVPAGLLFVKDRGIYLMSNGSPALPREDGEGSKVVYAFGYAPNCANWLEKARAAVGGDDFAQFLPLEWFEQPIENDDLITLEVTPDQIQIFCGRE